MSEQLSLWSAPEAFHPLVPEALTFLEGEMVFYSRVFSSQESDRLYTELAQTIQWRQDQIQMFGKLIPLPRLTAWYGDPGKSYTYSGIQMSPEPWTSALLEIKSRIEPLAGVQFNSVLLNQYRTGQDSMGWHSDDEPELGQNPVIGSVSLGGTRRFLLRHKHQKHRERLTLDLTDGSFLLMQGSLQHHWQHHIPKTSQAVPPRINLTFRVIY
ncbi:MAG: alpha-ketoglutarate-dependent dioxygenase AlkB [Leptolyngbyaceae bacterium]|nr:alpha-ketoglutarate-dependent dioxygenase AlkB [Leptolyngbyaceae bacterium]